MELGPNPSVEDKARQLAYRALMSAKRAPKTKDAKGLAEDANVWGSPYAHRGPAGRESGGVERHARDQLGLALRRTEHQMRSLVSITSDSDSSIRKWGQYPARTARRTGPPGWVVCGRFDTHIEGLIGRRESLYFHALNWCIRPKEPYGVPYTTEVFGPKLNS